MKLSFHATRIEAEVEADAPSLSFEVDSDADASVYFRVSSEDEAQVRVSLANGKKSVEDCVIRFASVELVPKKFKAAFAEPRPSEIGTFKAVEITFDELEPDDAGLAVDALTKLTKALGEKAKIDIPGAKPPPAVAPSRPSFVPRRTGSPQLGLVAQADSPWKGKPGQTIAIKVAIANHGGKLDMGLDVELGGAAIESGCVEAKEVEALGEKGAFAKKGTIAFAELAGTKIEADLDIDRKAARGQADGAPVIEATVSVKAVKAGKGLLTIRAIPKSKVGRTGGAMVGRPIVVE
jgi:hypothetical protein